MAILPSDVSPALVRLPSLLFSALFLAALGWNAILVRNEERAPHMLWLFLCACSYLLVLYGSEARGYAGLLAASAALYLVRERILQGGVLAFILICLVGILSHALFLLTLVGFLIWLSGMWWCKECPWKVFRNATALSCVLTLAVASPLYANLEIGGAPRLPYLEVLGSVLTQLIGGHALSPSAPAQSVWELFIGVAVFLACTFELYRWPSEAGREKVLVAVMIFLPIVAVAVAKPAFILPRYFIVPVFFSYYLLAKFLVRLMRAGVIGSGVAVLGIIGFVWLNTDGIVYLSVEGRAKFAHTLGLIARSDPAASFSSNQDFQTSIRLSVPEQLSTGEERDAVALQNGNALRLRYIPMHQPPDTNSQEMPDYFIVETIDRFMPPSPSTTWNNRGNYHLIFSWRSPGESGANLALYRRE